MNATQRAILSKINSLAPIGRYIILSEDEISECLDGGTDGESILKALKELSRDEYIDLKYSGGGMFCAAPLKEVEPEPVEIVRENQKEHEVVVVKAGTAAAFFAALLGGALGSIIASLILSVI